MQLYGQTGSAIRKVGKIGNNVHFASHVTFVTHDVVHMMVNRIDDTGLPKMKEKVGCIEIGDNVFVGTNVNILYNVKLGSNVVVAAGSIVTRDVPDNSVVGGVPAKVLGTFDAFLDKRMQETNTAEEHMLPSGEYVAPEVQKKLWDRFNQERNGR